MEGKNHYFCSVCGGISDKPRNCATVGCSNKGQPLEKCVCENPNEHKKENTDECCSSCSSCSGCCGQ